jgi:hypothetical protein
LQESDVCPLGCTVVVPPEGATATRAAPQGELQLVTFYQEATRSPASSHDRWCPQTRCGVVGACDHATNMPRPASNTRIKI